jgi:hypothetical protein
MTHQESVRLNPDTLCDLYDQMGEAGAEDVICRAIEELAVRLTHCERSLRTCDLSALAKSARSLIAIAEQVGMTALARAADHVRDAAQSGDRVASASTLFRLIRIGERSLTAVWDQRDLSI